MTRTPAPRVNELIDQLVNLDFRADIDPSSRLVQNEHAGLARSHLARTTFC